MSQPNTPAPADAQARCPLCGQANQCAVAAGLDPKTCWCMQATISPNALEKIPAADRGKRCACAHCGCEVSAAGASNAA